MNSWAQIVRKFSLLAIILLVGHCYAFAQAVNTGAGPYINSWHSYRVIVGSTSNTIEWDIINEAETVTHDLSGSTPAWSVIDALSGNNADISVYFTDAVFNYGERWYLRYREFTGPTTCVAARQFEINITENDFYLTLDANQAICKPQSGSLRDWDNVDDETYNAQIVYTVTLNKEEHFTISGWSFEASIDLTPAGHNHSLVNYTVAVEPLGEGTATITDDSEGFEPALNGNFRVDLSGLTTPDREEVSALITVTVSGLLHQGLTATLNLNNGLTTHGVNDNITFDNTDRPTDMEQPVAALRDREQVVELYPLPSTKNILPGAGETAWSAGNPLQNSTHRYVVELGDFANNARLNTGWHIETGAGVPVATDFTLTRTNNSTSADTATIEFNMAPGSYVLYFTEESVNSCTAVRAFPFTIGEPFDVDILAASPTCAAISGQVNNLFVNQSTTAVSYIIELQTAGYDSDWSFNFDISSIPGFSNPDLTEQLIGTSTTGATYNSGTGLVSVSNSIGDPVTSVEIVVTYIGYYETEHEITATLTNITGSFNEEDADATNETVHTIYAMPQAGELAGVD